MATKQGAKIASLIQSGVHWAKIAADEAFSGVAYRLRNKGYPTPIDMMLNGDDRTTIAGVVAKHS